MSATLSLRAAWDRFGELLHGDRYLNGGFGLDTRTFRVNAAGPEAEQAGLPKEDIVVGVNGRRAQ